MTETEMLSVFGAGMIRDNDMGDTCRHVFSRTISRAIIRSNMGTRDQRVRNHNKLKNVAWNSPGLSWTTLLRLQSWTMNHDQENHEYDLTPVSWLREMSNLVWSFNILSFLELKFTELCRTVHWSSDAALVLSWFMWMFYSFFRSLSQGCHTSHFQQSVESWVSSSQSISSHTCPIILTIIWTISAPHNSDSIKQDLRLCKHWVQLRSFIDRLVQISHWPGHPWYSQEKCFSKHSLQWMLNHECLISEFYYTTSYQQLEYSFVYLYSVTIIHSQRK